MAKPTQSPRKPGVAALSPRDFLARKSDPESRQAYFTNPAPARNGAALPRRIFAYWDSGAAGAPEVIRLCLERWRAQNPGWQVTPLDAGRARDIVDPGHLAHAPYKPHYADILRSHILAGGGVWVDATLCCQRPLGGWLPGVFNQADFSAFHRPGRDRMLANWFLAATPESQLMQAWHRLTAALWSEPGYAYPPYYWHHYLFEYMVRSSPKHRRQRERLPRLAAEPMTILKRHFVDPEASNEDLERARHTPVQKLDRKHAFDLAALRETLDDLSAPVRR